MRVVAIVAALLAVSSAQASQPSPARLYGVVWSGRDGNLSRLDPSTLEPVGQTLTFREFGAWSFSPDRDRLAVGGSYAPDVRFDDMAGLQTIRTVLLGPSGAVERNRPAGVDVRGRARRRRSGFASSTSARGPRGRTDAGADGFAVADGALLAFGVRSEWSATSSSLSGMGVAAYAPDGSARFHVLQTVPVGGMQVDGSHAYGWVANAVNPWHLVVVDVASGTVERELELTRPTRLLLGDGSLF